MGMFSMRDLIKRPQQPGQPDLEGDSGFQMEPDGDTPPMPQRPGDGPLSPPSSMPRPIHRGPYGDWMDRERKMMR